MKAHVTLPGVSGRMAQVVDVGEGGKRISRGHAASGATGHEYGDKSKDDLFSTAKELAKGNRRRAAPSWSAPAELFLICASPSYLSVGPRRFEGIGVEEITKTAKKYTRAKRELVSVLVHAQRAFHTPCRAHYSNGTLIDKHNGQKGMLGTRIIHVPCPGWKSLYAVMARETITEGRGKHFFFSEVAASFADEGEKEQCSHNDAWDGT